MQGHILRLCPVAARSEPMHVKVHGRETRDCQNAPLLCTHIGRAGCQQSRASGPGEGGCPAARRGPGAGHLCSNARRPACGTPQARVSLRSRKDAVEGICRRGVWARAPGRASPQLQAGTAGRAVWGPMRRRVRRRAWAAMAGRGWTPQAPGARTQRPEIAGPARPFRAPPGRHFRRHSPLNPPGA